MVFVFPDFETLRFALTSGQVPPAVGLAPARVGRDADSRPWVQPIGPVPHSLPTALRRIGVSVLETGPDGGMDVAHWLQALPLRRDPTPTRITDQTPVLFEVPAVDGLATLVGEMLRLGNDRQGFRILNTASGAPSVLLRVIGPPWYTLLRALDRLGPDPPRAYVEATPRVWIEAGYTHPLATLLRAPEGHAVLLRSPQDWVYFGDAPFRDVYEVLEFALPGGETAWVDSPPTGTLDVPVRLAPDGRNEPAEHWVLTGAGVEQIDAFVRDADDRLIARLLFAIGEFDGERLAVLRARPGKSEPPKLVFDGLDYRSYARLPNLFVPVGQRLRPPLRRDAVRQLIADDPDRITWLAPAEGGSFVPQSLPDSAFRPLSDWVEYVLDKDAPALTAWADATRIDFAPFVSKETMVVASQAALRERRPRSERPRDATAEPATPRAVDPAPKSGPKPARQSTVDAFPTLPTAPPSELQQRLKETEKRFLAVEGSLDAPERQALWPELARFNAALGHTADAALCWGVALWEATDPAKVTAFAQSWIETEKALPRPDPTVSDLDRLLGNTNPTLPDLRPLAAVVAWAARQRPVPSALREQLPAVREYLEAHDHLLPVRMVWLAWHGLAHLTGTDVLTLARVRDRLLARLLTNGLGAERDLPGFLRFAGQREGDRMRRVREHTDQLRKAAQAWFEQTAQLKGPRDQTPAYIDLMFAFGMARLGEATSCRHLLDQSAVALAASGDEAHQVLLEAFRYRIEQVLAGRPHGGPLPAEHIEYVDQLRRERADRPIDNADPGSRAWYVADRLREQSRILEPDERYDPYRHRNLTHGTELTREVATLPEVTDRSRLNVRIRELIRRTSDTPSATPPGRSLAKHRFSVLSHVLPLAATRVGGELAGELLQLVIPALEAAPPPNAHDPLAIEEYATLLERSLFFAAHFDRPDLVRSFVEQIERLLSINDGSGLLEAIGPLVGQTVRSLGKLGLRDEAERLLDRVMHVVSRDRTMVQLKAEDSRQWPHTLYMLVQIATGWLAYDGHDRAKPILNEARATILQGEGGASSRDSTRYVALICAYVTALGRLPVDEAVGRVLELLTPGKLSKLPNTHTSNTHYSRFHLNVVESVVLSLANEDFAIGPTVRRWLDDDEYLVRRRIHRDVKSVLS